MSSEKNVQLIAVVGMTGAGKSSVVDYLTKKGYPKVYFGGVIYDAMREAGVPQGEDNEKIFRNAIREREGKDFVIRRIIKQIRDLNNAGQHKVIVDGLYAWYEYQIMKHEFPGEVTFVGVVAPRHLRYKRVAARKERPQTPAESEKRDWNEIDDFQKGCPIAMADYFVMNDGDIEKLHRDVDAILSEIKFYDN
jgi:dephospho-CoA kinase